MNIARGLFRAVAEGMEVRAFAIRKLHGIDEARPRVELTTYLFNSSWTWGRGPSEAFRSIMGSSRVQAASVGLASGGTFRSLLQ